MNSLLSAENLGLLRGDRCLFESLEFALNAGDVLHIVGPNGSGKTSLLRVIAGLVAPECGDVFWCDQPVRKVAQEFRAEMTWLGHKVGCKQDLTLMENLRVELALRPAASGQLSDVLERLQLQSLTQLPMRALSAGQQRRVSLARLLLGSARLWLMDEPFTNLDRAGQSLVGALMDEHVAAGGLCVAASHQPLAIDSPQHQLALS